MGNSIHMSAHGKCVAAGLNEYVWGGMMKTNETDLIKI